MTEEFSKYERARIIGARGLQIAMDAPLLKKFSKEEMGNLNFDPLRLAEKELDSGVLPISINRPMPKKTEEEIEDIDEIEKESPSDRESEHEEEKEEKEIVEEDSEIMELASDEDEDEESLSAGDSKELE
jgi:DNA-directed RNA polymerase subunit K/omega